jgi:hypothetical protein
MARQPMRALRPAYLFEDSALAAIRHAKALQSARYPWLTKYPDLSAYDRPRPQLRLVVDNTQ